MRHNKFIYVLLSLGSLISLNAYRGNGFLAYNGPVKTDDTKELCFDCNLKLFHGESKIAEISYDELANYLNVNTIEFLDYLNISAFGNELVLIKALDLDSTYILV